LLTLFEPIVTILVVDLTRLRIRQSFVSFSHFDELLFGAFITPIRLLAGGQRRTDGMRGKYGFLSGWYFLLRVRYARLISRSEACLSIPSNYKELVCKLRRNARGLLYRNPRRMQRAGARIAAGRGRRGVT
jgi:hypothetical protein